MSRKIAIIGMGNVGAAVAHGAIDQGLADSYVFIDINEKKAEADAQDFKDAMANLPSYANIVVNDYAALEDADVIISSIGNIQLQHNAGEDRFAEFPFTREAVYQVSQELKKLDKRRSEGIAAAKLKGVKFGRPRIPLTDEFKFAYEEWRDKNIPAVKLMERLHLKPGVFYKLAKEYETTLPMEKRRKKKR